MKKPLIFFVVLMIVSIGFKAKAQVEPKLKKQIIEAKPQSLPSSEVDQLEKPVNIKDKPVAEEKSRGDVCCPEYSEIIIDNWNGYYVDIYVNGKYRGTVSPWDKKVTWAIPGTNTLYAKVEFSDGGSLIYWGPIKTNIGYQYTWKLMPK